PTNKDRPAYYAAGKVDVDIAERTSQEVVHVSILARDHQAGDCVSNFQEFLNRRIVQCHLAVQDDMVGFRLLLHSQGELKRSVAVVARTPGKHRMWKAGGGLNSHWRSPRRSSGPRLSD